MSDLLKVKVGGSDYLCKWEPSNYVEIGGITYRTVKIGNRIWMAEDLKNEFDGITINPAVVSSTLPYMYYNTTSPLDAYGGHYNYPSVALIEANKSTLCPGWHVANISDFTDLFNSIGGISNAPSVLRDITWGGTDQYDFHLKPSGYWSSTGLSLFGTKGYLWSSDPSGSHVDMSDSTCTFSTQYGNHEYAFPVRLVKDVT